MIKLPINTILGKLEYVEIFDFFDIPRLFLCQNAVGTKYLVLCIYDDIETYEWLYMEISNGRLSAILLKHISLYDAFVNPENDHLLKVSSDYDGNSCVSHILPDSLPIDDLPDKDAFIAYNGKIKTDFSLIDVRDAALSSRRDVFNFHFYPQDTRLPEMSIKLIGAVLVAFQNLVDSLGEYCYGSVTSKSVISRKAISTRTRLNAVQIFDGSFGLQLKSHKDIDLFADIDSSSNNLISNSLEQLSDLLSAADNEKILTEKLHQFQGRVGSKYKAFLTELINLDSPMKAEWGSADKNKGGTYQLSKEEIARALDIVSKVETEQDETIELTAELVGAYTDTKRFKIKNLKDNESYSGSISKEALNDVLHAELNGTYSVALKKIIETNPSSGQESIKWDLVKLQKKY
ncbi:DUF6575 domain-containing protein [Thioflexithrix psekupsensis]|uniref:DUF6575 domain-containing protein n=1 Tax=Thioflexithrix psekupsensis TaxID=1570016 RepID=A0A251X7D4_9GAMM|nr:DUF6575 domain-containing protein [Thioflexithrix psekupsensis]OUD13099.1 hypothetical protein TPSD3_10645 [Thioflexithrix psekupsensis]